VPAVIAGASAPERGSAAAQRTGVLQDHGTSNNGPIWLEGTSDE